MAFKSAYGVNLLRWNGKFYPFYLLKKLFNNLELNGMYDFLIFLYLQFRYFYFYFFTINISLINKKEQEIRIMILIKFF